MIASLAAAVNGERAVVLLFVARVVCSLPLSLLPYGISLCVLTVVALSVEIRVDGCPSVVPFRTRRGASSGILLGAVTLPAVLLSKLMQLWRALLLDQVSAEEIHYLKMLYWAASASCIGVLLFLTICIQRSSSESSPNAAHAHQNTKLVLSCITVYGALCFFSLLTISQLVPTMCIYRGTQENSLEFPQCAYTEELRRTVLSSSAGLQHAFNISLVAFHGLAAVILIQHALKTFPSCASIGEALLVTTGLVLYSGDMLACTLVKVNEKFLLSDSISSWFGNKRSERSIIIQGLLLGLLAFPLIFKILLQTMEAAMNRGSTRLAQNEYRRSILFFASLGLYLAVFIPSWMQFTQDFISHPYLRVLSFVLSEPVKRLTLCIYWVGLICASVFSFYNISKNSKTERILLRKYYHLMAVSMFSPALIFQPEFLNLAFGFALAVFLALEIVRVWRIWPLGKLVHQFMNAFTDHRDSDLLIVSHFSLLLGCALPIWMSFGYTDRPLAPFAGILSLGIGDTMASMVGHKYGVLRWSKTGKKTIEGTAAGIMSVLVACSVLLPLLASTGYLWTQHWFSLLFAVTVGGLLEAYTAQLDNAFIPLVFYSLLCL